MEQIIRILMKVHEAIGLGDYTLAEDIFTGDLGLEIDYLLETLTI